MRDALWQDVRYALRSFRASPGFTLVVVLTLGLSVGANAALFSVVNALVFRRLPVTDPDRLVTVGVENERGQEQPAIYLPTFEAFQARQHSFEIASLYSGGGLLPAEIHGALVDGNIEGVTRDYYKVLGVRPLIGRLLADDDMPQNGDAARVVVLSWQFWQRNLGGDSKAIGDTLIIQNVPLTIVGVMPPGFHGLQVDGGADFTMPLAVLRDLAGDRSLPPRGYNMIGRRRADVSLEQARAEILAIWPGLRDATLPAGLSPAQRTQTRALRAVVQSARGGFSTLRKRYASPMAMLLGLAGLLLAIGCANLSGLLLSRAISRSSQVAVRIALGATRWRLLQQVAVEALLLALSGAALALAMAWWVSQALGNVIWNNAARPLGLSMTPDARVLAVSAVVALATALVVAVLPAWLTTASHTTIDVQSSRTTTSIRRSGRALLVAQVALSLMLVFGAGLFGRSLMRLRSNETFSSRRVLFGRLSLKPAARSVAASAFDAAYYRDIVRRLSQIAGVESVAFCGNFPAAFSLPGRPEPFSMANAADSSGDFDALVEAASPDFFDTVGITRLRGRDFTWSDDSTSAPVAIVSARLAATLFTDGEAVGRTLRASRDSTRTPLTIVGVVADAPIGNFRDPRPLVVYRALLQDPDRRRQPIVHVRTRASEADTGDAMVRLATGGPHYLRRTTSLDTQVNDAVLQERLLAWLASAFAGLAVLIACVGLYGFLAYSVARRTREIGVRMALGASRSAVLGMVLWEGCSLALVGVAVGVPCALAIAPVTRSLLYGLAPADPAALIGAGVVFTIVATLASWLPAWRAASLNPMQALRRD
jgi:putative ABC transport system permease protein